MNGLCSAASCSAAEPCFIATDRRRLVGTAIERMACPDYIGDRGGGGYCGGCTRAESRVVLSPIGSGGGGLGGPSDAVPDELDGDSGTGRPVATDRRQGCQLRPQRFHHRARTRLGPVLRRPGGAPRWIH